MTATETELGFTRAIAAADAAGLAREVAVMATDSGLGTLAGEVYRPVEESVPKTGFMDQATAVLPLPVTVALNCCACPAVSVACGGLILTDGFPPELPFSS